MKKLFYVLVFLTLSGYLYGQSKIRLSQIEDIQGTVIKSTGEASDRFLMSNGSNGSAWTIPSNLAYKGTLTTNYIPKYGVNQLENSQIFDNGTNVGIGTTAPGNALSLGSTFGKIFALYEATGGGNQYGIGTAISDWPFRTTLLANGVEVMSLLATGNVGIGTAAPTEKLEVAGKTKTTSFQMTTGATANYYLKSDISGNGTWSEMSFTETDPVFSAHTVENIVDGTGYLKNNGAGTWTFDNSSYSLYNHDHAATYEPIITSGSAFQYIRGDKTLRTLNTFAVPESGNLYFTDTRARDAISLTTTGTSGAATYTPATGVLNIPNYATGGGFTDPMTTRGDIIYRNSSNVTARLPLGTNGQILTSNGSDLYYSTPTPPSIYSLPLAANGTRGGLQIGYTETANNFALKLSSEKGYIDLPDASAITKGIAKFSDTNFATSFGTVSLANAGVSYNHLDNATISGLAAVSSGITDTDEIMLSYGGMLRKADVSVLGDYLETYLTPAPAGANMQIQFNSSGLMGAEAGFEYNASTNTMDADAVTVNTEAYDATGWDADLSVPTKDALRDKIESMQSAYENYYINSTQTFSAGVNGYINIYTTPSNTASTIFAAIDMHIDHGEGTYKHISGHFSSDWAANTINKQNWVEQYSDFRTSNITLTPELVDNGTTATFRIKVNSPVSSSHHYVLTVKYLHKL